MKATFDNTNHEQQLAYDMIAKTSQSFFLTGRAGTGKTTFLKAVQQEVAKNFVVVAPTGVAAVNAGGKTIHSFFGLGETFTDFASQAAVMDKFWLFLFALVLCMPVRKLIADTTERILKNHSIMLNGAILVGRTVLSLAVLVLSVALLVGATNNAFLYTRF